MLIFSPDPKESNTKVVHEPLKMKILGTCVKIPRRRLKGTFTSESRKPASLRLEMYSLSLFEIPPSGGFMFIFIPGPKESNTKVVHEPVKMKILGTCVEIPTRRLKRIFTPESGKPASLGLGIYSMSLFEIPLSRGFILIFNSGPKESNTKVVDEPLKMTVLCPCTQKNYTQKYLSLISVQIQQNREGETFNAQFELF